VKLKQKGHRFEAVSFLFFGLGVRTERSNLCGFIVHFFVKRQMKRCFGCAETQRKRS
jgi:hypothetical protein